MMIKGVKIKNFFDKVLKLKLNFRSEDTTSEFIGDQWLVAVMTRRSKARRDLVARRERVEIRKGEGGIGSGLGGREPRREMGFWE